MPEEKIVSNYATYLTIIPIIPGILGFALGVYNTFVAHFRNKVNLKVNASLHVITQGAILPLTESMLSNFSPEKREELIDNQRVEIGRASCRERV